MNQESKGNVFCIVHQCPLSECSDECPVKQGAKSTAQLNSKKVWAKALVLPITNEDATAQAQVEVSVKIAEQIKKQKAQMERLRKEQEELLGRSKKGVLEDDPDKPKDD